MAPVLISLSPLRFRSSHSKGSKEGTGQLTTHLPKPILLVRRQALKMLSSHPTRQVSNLHQLTQIKIRVMKSVLTVSPLTSEPAHPGDLARRPAIRISLPLSKPLFFSLLFS
jgi:hypothetical protein